MNVTLNGERRDLPERASVADAIVASGAEPGGRGMAVAVDGEVVPRGAWDGVELRDGARVEVVKAVQGG